MLRALAALRGHGDCVRRRGHEAEVSERHVLARRRGSGLRKMFADRTVRKDFLISLIIHRF